MKAIEIENLSFRYSEESKYVIKNLSLSVDKGDFLCVLGENGSGKSTLSRLINGLLTPTEGDVKVFGLSVKDKNFVKEIRKKVGIVFQNPDNQMIATIVEDDVAFAPENLGYSPSEIEERINFALDSVNMQKFRYSAGQRLSGGQKQRVAIAGVLAVKPDVLILDESTSMLDPLGREEVLNVVKKLNQDGITVISITHYMDEVVNANKVAVLSDGEIVMQGTPSEIFKHGKELKSYGLDIPRATYIANALKENGLAISNEILTKESLAEELCKLFQKA